MASDGVSSDSRLSAEVVQKRRGETRKGSPRPSGVLGEPDPAGAPGWSQHLRQPLPCGAASLVSIREGPSGRDHAPLPRLAPSLRQRVGGRTQAGCSVVPPYAHPPIQFWFPAQGLAQAMLEGRNGLATLLCTEANLFSVLSCTHPASCPHPALLLLLIPIQIQNPPAPLLPKQLPNPDLLLSMTIGTWT